MKFKRSIGLPLIGANVALVLVLSACDSSASTSGAGTKPSKTSPSPATTTQTTTNTAPSETSEGSGHGTTKATKSPSPVATATTVPTEPPSSGVQNSVLDSLPGSKDQGCVSVRGERDVRSGDLAVGNFETARQQYANDDSGSEQPTVSFYVIPRHTKPMSGVKVTMKPMDRSGHAVSATSDAAQTANSWHYYSVSLSVASPGAWRLTAISGPDRGCFDVTFKR